MELVGERKQPLHVVEGAARGPEAPRPTLPLQTRSQCTCCTRVLPATLSARAEAVVLERRCPEHGAIREVLSDVIFTPPAAPDREGSPTHTRTGARIRPVVRALPKTVETLCPECAQVVVGRVFEWQGDVFMEKSCPAHGYVRDRIFTNSKLFLKLQQGSFRDGAGLENPQVADARGCPGSCGLCNLHQSHTMLGQVDLTNRCNLACPVCFANANVQGFVVEPSFDEIVKLLKALRDYRPTPASAVQLTGGEPTVRKDYLDIVREAKALGFSHVQTASNGIKFAEPGFARAAAEAGLHTVYLQFDGVDDRVYVATRGRPLLDVKKRAVQAIHDAGMKICLVPTIVRGVNDDQVAKILRFAVDHIHVVSGIAYQPVAFTGRIDTAEREAQRYTMGDLANGLAETGLVDPMRDFYPLSLVAPISRLLAAVSGQPKITATSHPSCSSGTYFLVSPAGKAVPITRVFDIEGLFRDVDALAGTIERAPRWLKRLHALRVPLLFRRHFRRENAPEGLTVRTFLHALRGMTDKRVGRGEAGETTYRTLLAAAMHFQDRYNYDVERVKRCVIHYSTPEGMFPFCAYNSGPIHRTWIERKHAIPLAEWKLRNRAEA